MAHNPNVGMPRRKLKSPAARARARQIALLRAQIRQRATHLMVVLALLAPFAIMALFGQARVALGVPPSISTVSPQTLSYTEDAFLIIDPAIEVTDPDVATGEARIITANFVSGNPGTAQMLVRNVGNISVTGSGPFQVNYSGTVIGSYPASGIGAGVSGLPLQVTITHANMTVTDAIIEEVMRAIAYTDTSQNPVAPLPNRVVEFQIVDSIEGPSGALQYTINSVTQTNDPPEWTVPAGPLPVADDTNLAIDPDPTIVDADAGANPLVFAISVPAGEGTLTMTGCSVTGSGTNSLAFNAATSTANTCLQTLVYKSPVGFSGTVTISYSADDQGFAVGSISTGVGLVGTATTTVQVEPVNDPPTLSDPGAQSVIQNQPLAIPAITLADSDAASGTLEATLSVSHGTLDVNEALAATVTGDGTASVTLTGTVAQLDAALDTIVYTSSGSYTGAETLTVTVDDQGNTGSGGPQTATLNIGITVGAFNDPPVVTVPGSAGGGFDGSATVTEDVATGVSGISVADADAGAAPISVSLTVSAGTLTLGSTSGLTLQSGANSSAAMSFSGSLTDWNNALATLTYLTASNSVADATLSVLANDLGNTGDDGAKTNLKTVRLSVSAVNDAPTVGVPSAQTTNEDTALVFLAGNSNQITVADVDVGSGNLRITLGVTQGTLTLASTTNLTFQSGANGTAAMSFDGPLADVLTALNGLSYQPILNYTGGDTLTVTANDLGNTGSGTPPPTVETVGITVGAINDPPTITSPGGTLTPAEDTPFAITGVSIADVDANPDDVRVTLTATNGTVSVKPSAIAALSFGAGDGTDDATMTFDGTLAEVNDALSGLSFLGTLNHNGAASVAVDVSDLGHNGTGGAQTATATINLLVGALNDGPVVSVPSPTATATEDTPLTINGVGISVADPDAASFDIEVTLSASHGSLTLDAGALAALTSVTGNGTHTVVFRGTVSEVNDALNPLTYQGDLNNVLADTLSISANDLGNSGAGGPLTGVNSIAISFTAVNDAPVLTVPASANIDEDVATTVAGVSVLDVDSASSNIEVMLSVTGGTIGLTNTTGLTVVGGANNSASVTFSGTVSALTTALSSLTYQTALDGTANQTLTIFVDDKGFTGTGGNLTDTEVVNLLVAAQNDAPTVTITPSTTRSGNEDVSFAITGVSVADVDAGSNPVQVTLTTTFGTLTISPTGLLSFSVGDGSGDKTMTFTGTVTNVNAALANLSYLGDANFNGTDSIQVQVSDQGNTGLGGTKTGSGTVQIQVNGVNDPPVVTPPGGQSATEDTDKAIPAITVADPDVGALDMQVTLSAANGTLTMTTRTGLAFSTGDGVSDATMTFSGSLAHVNAALATVVYRGNQDFNGPDTITITPNDLGHTGSAGPAPVAATISVTVSAENDGPVITVPAPQTAVEDTNLIITGVDIRVDDVDIGTNPIDVYLSVGNGVLTLSTTANLTFSLGDGVTDATLQFQGTLTDVNNALAQLVYRANLNYSGPDPLTIVAGDLGSTGAGGPKFDNKVLSITVPGVNDAPVVSVPGAQSVTEDVNKTITGVSIADPDVGSSPMRVTIGVTQGALTLASTAGLTFTSGDGTGDTGMVFSGTLANVNAALASVVYRGNQDYFGTDTLTVTAEDLGATGTGGPLTHTATVTLNIAPVNDAPVVTFPGPISTASTPAAVLVDGQATVADVDSPNFDTGTLTVNISSGASSSDRLNIRNQGTGSGQIGVSGATITYGGTPIGTYSGEASGAASMTVTFNANATRAAVEALLRNVTFRITDAEPTVSNRTVRFVLTDGDGETSAPTTKQVRVAPLADLTLTATDTGRPFYIRNEIVAHTVKIVNRGPLTATGVVLTNRLPDGLVFQSIQTSQGTCNGGQVVTCNIGSVAVGDTITVTLKGDIRTDLPLVSTFEITSTSDDPNPADNRLAIEIRVLGPNHPGDDKPIERDKKEKFTEEQRQQTQRTNRLGLDDYRTEGNVVDVNFLAAMPYAVIAMRDGRQQVVLPCKEGCPDAKVGDYLEADGVKEHEYLFYAESVTLTRNGKKVKP